MTFFLFVLLRSPSATIVEPARLPALLLTDTLAVFAPLPSLGEDVATLPPGPGSLRCVCTQPGAADAQALGGFLGGGPSTVLAKLCPWRGSPAATFVNVSVPEPLHCASSVHR